MSNHTPGPWWVEVDNDETWIEAKSQTVCGRVSNCDASLIAAAPELLGACKAVISEFTEWIKEMEGLQVDESPCIALVRAAIAKAEAAA